RSSIDTSSLQDRLGEQCDPFQPPKTIIPPLSTAARISPFPKLCAKNCCPSLTFKVVRVHAFPAITPVSPEFFAFRRVHPSTHAHSCPHKTGRNYRRIGDHGRCLDLCHPQP